MKGQKAMDSSDYKRIGKASLVGKWGIAIGAYFVALLLGGTVADSFLLIRAT